MNTLETGIMRLLRSGITGEKLQLPEGFSLEEALPILKKHSVISLAYQGAELGFDTVAKLNLENPDIRTPDLCIFLDLLPEQSLQRIGARADVPREIYENYEYLDKTRKMFFDVFEKLLEKGEKIVIIDASGDALQIADAVLDATLKLF